MRTAHWKKHAILFAIAFAVHHTDLQAEQNPGGENAKDAPVDFNRDIRPILSDKCFTCHGPDEEARKADLRLDLRDDAVDFGAITPGDAEASSLIERIVSDDPEFVMPPPETGKPVSKDEAKLFAAWIENGAPYDQHWAFLAPTRPELPKADSGARIANPIDRFVVAKLNRRSLSQSDACNKVTLVRRLHLDLTGLPPTPEQVDAFLSEKRDDADQRLIESLLASPHFGEHWARWWLDAARYSDSDGYEKDKPRRVWFYRDYIIDAMNSDKPYDQFVIEQIAGDLLPDATQSQIVATGFLRNSMVNEEGGADPEQFRVEGMFDRVDAIGKAILGITTQCAQCHTHKYDPISHREYYQMFAALNDFHEAIAPAFTPEQEAERQRVFESITAIESDLKANTSDWNSRFENWTREQSAKLVNWQTMTPKDLPYEGQKFKVLDDGSIVSESYAPTKVTNTFSLITTVDEITAFRIDALMHPQLPRGGPGRSIYGTGALSEFEVAIAPKSDPAKKRTIKFAKAISDVNPDRAELPAIYRDKDPTKDDRVTGPIEYAIDGDGKTAWSTDIGPGRRNQNRHAIFIPAEPITETGEVILSFTLKQLHGGWNSDDNQNYLLGRYRFSITGGKVEQIEQAASLPSNVEKILRKPVDKRTDDEQNTLFSHWRATVDQFATANEKIESLWKQFPEPDTQLVVQAMPKPRETHVFERGDFLKHGERVEPNTPEFLPDFPKTDEPARLRFAKWLVADDAPTTARVIVNRIWQSYFGRGIVTTPEDFGFQSAAPSHPKLLDWLAVELMENDWRLKHVHRLIVTSETYRQSSVVGDKLRELDPYNELLARGPRVRVNAESVRDIALSVSGLLSDQIGGPSVYPPAPEFLFQPPASYGPKIWDVSTGAMQYRRSLYVHSYRSVQYPPLQVFDAPKGDAACVRRQRSNTPLQALVMLNEPQFVQCAQAMAARVLEEVNDDDQARITRMFRLCVARQPSSKELAILQRLLDQQRHRIATGEVKAEDMILKIDSEPKEKKIAPDQLAPWMIVSRAILNMDETITKQ